MKDTSKLIKALEILAQDIESDDGVANTVIAEAATTISELVAKAEALLVHGTTLATAASMATGAMAIGSSVTELCIDAVARFNAVKETAPQQHLAEIRAEAGRAGFVACIRLAYELQCPPGTIHADLYAEEIRQGEVE